MALEMLSAMRFRVTDEAEEEAGETAEEEEQFRELCEEAAAVMAEATRQSAGAGADMRVGQFVQRCRTAGVTVDCNHRWTEKLTRLRRSRGVAVATMEGWFGADWRAVVEQNIDISRARYENEMFERALRESPRPAGGFSQGS
eukprot:4346793-Prymnesium_polylepis.2